jgi:hypothetical protein
MKPTKIADTCWPPPACPAVLAGTWPAAPARASTDYAAKNRCWTCAVFQRHAGRHGVFTDRSGKVVKRFTVVMECRWQGDEGVLDEAFTYSDGTTQRRIWRLTRWPTAATPAAPTTWWARPRAGARQRLPLDLHHGPARGRQGLRGAVRRLDVPDRRQGDAQPAVMSKFGIHLGE